MCQRVEDLLEACDKWDLSISVAKSFWGTDKIGGLKASPKELKSLTDLPFPGSLRSMQSFLGSLNYCSRFIEDYAIYDSVLYKLREVEFAELEKRSDLREILDRNDPIVRDRDPPELKLTAPVEERWIRAHITFITLKTKIATTPVLRHFDETRTPVVIVYASNWAISASLTQEQDGIYHPTNELNYNLTEKEVLALLRILDLYYNLLVGREIRVLTRHSTLAWLFKSTGLQSRLGQWFALLAPWTLEITKCTKGEDEILGGSPLIDDALTEIAPRKEPNRRIQAPIPTVDRDEELWVISFDGSARVKGGGGAFNAIVWSLPGWEVIKARSGYLESLTVNEAEYNGLILGLDMLEDLDRRRLVVCGDSNLVIRQVRGEVDCKAPRLTLLKRKALDRLRKWRDHELVHVKRDWNGSADSLASPALQRQKGIEVQEGPGYQDLVTLNWLDEILIPKIENQVVRVAAVTTRAGRARSPAGVMEEGLIREIRIDRIKRAQEEEVWIAGMKKYLSGSIADLPQAEARSYSKIATDYEVDEHDLLFYCPPRAEIWRRSRPIDEIVPETLQSDVLHHYHTTVEGGHQGVGRTYQRIRDHFHWRGLYRSVQRYVGECVDCETGKGRPVIRGESPGNLQATYPFQIIAMDHIPSLPRSHKGSLNY
ncbi:LOW QUALITY PROTEIN: reverse transcriptase [Phytophthora megakarya]|uniref:Reverse transcriptase n=1 Tax=Phytophthora megakarya TaxID=4795 RepID=A0A225V7T4_9STRA|nr:LOW QUALITY PROTEIN: reverse transcriptase [Phytophthora megakarya]